MNMQKLTKQILQMELRQRSLEERQDQLEKEVRESKKDITRELFTIEEVARISQQAKRKVSLDFKGSVIKAKFPRAKRKFTLEQVQDYLRGL